MVFSTIERIISMNEDNTLRIPVEPVVLPCDECQGEAYPNYRYELVGMSGVLCKPCLNKELETINAVLSKEQEDRGYDEDFLEALKLENWTCTSMLHTPTADIQVLDSGNVQFTLPDSQFELKPVEANALIRYLFRELYKLPQIVCLVGSLVEPDAFKVANLQETKAGNIVLVIDTNLLVTGGITEEDKQRLYKLHKRKIDLCDEVLCVSRHIGESTRAEIAYAESKGKYIRYAYPENDPLENFRAKRVD